MQIDSAESLINELRSSGLLTPEQLLVVVRDLASQEGDFQSLLRHLVSKKRLTVYQLRKVIHGKTSELFLGPYVISDRIGEGGMGKVYRATQVRLGREVALKVVRTSLLNNPLVRKRYNREVETASALNHPNIVGVYDAGEVEGKYYLAMEFVDGIDLSKLVRQFPLLEVTEVCEYVRQASLGLQYAHEQGLVHRDIKPSNIVVSGERHLPQASERATVKILDMGLVRTVGFDEDGGGGGDLTRAGTVVGTPDYMAPEQAKNSSSVDRRADLYSLGCTMYFLLSGQPPFPTGTPIEKLLKHQLDTPTPIQALRPSVPSTVAEVISRLIAKEPVQRIQTAAELVEIVTPLALYPAGTHPVSIHSRHSQPAAATAETFPSPSRSTLPPIPTANSTAQLQQTEQQPMPLAEAVAPCDHTPSPGDPQSKLHAVLDSGSPFSSLGEPASGPEKSILPKEQLESSTQPSLRTIIWLVVSLVLLALAWIALVLAFGNRIQEKQKNSSAATLSQRSDSSSKQNPRPGLSPNIRQLRLLA